jgi:hypothetical protein
MTGLSQGEAAAVLRGVPQNSHVELVVSRQVTEESDVLASESLVRILPYVALDAGLQHSWLTKGVIYLVKAQIGFKLMIRL